MSATEFAEGGIDLEEGIRIASILQDHCDIIQASCGMVTEKYMTWTHPCQHMGYHPNLWLAEAFKSPARSPSPSPPWAAWRACRPPRTPSPPASATSSPWPGS